MHTKARAKHKFCRRLGYCIWDSPKCPSVKRPFAAGPHGKTGKKKKLSTYGELLLEKQKLKQHYGLSERQLVVLYKNAKRGLGMTNEKLFRNIEMRLDAAVYHSGMAPTIGAAKQFVNHRHVLVNGKIVDRSSFRLKGGNVVTINAEKSPSIAEYAKNTNRTVPPYLDFDRENLKMTVLRDPDIAEIPAKIEIMKVIEYYAR